MELNKLWQIRKLVTRLISWAEFYLGKRQRKTSEDILHPRHPFKVNLRITN